LRLPDVIPDVDMLVALEPEELGLRLLPVLSHWQRNSNFLSHLSLENFSQSVAPDHTQGSIDGGYPANRVGQIRQALREAWAWLEGQALLVSHPGFIEPHSIRVLSRKACKLAVEPNARRVFSSRMIPKEQLNPRIREDVWSLFHRGKYDTAVFEAMKAVEVAVRDASGFGARDIGTALMRKAFDPEIGPLTDMTDEKSEREARSALFAGAIGSYKNPHSHRKVALDDPDEAAEIIMLGNHLLRIVDARAAAKAAP